MKKTTKVVKAIPAIMGAFVLLQAADESRSQGNIEWHTWDESPEGTPAEVTVTESDAHSTTFEVVIHGFFIEELERETDQGTMTFSRILLPRDTMTNWGTTTSPGRAELPVIRRYIAVLSDAGAAEITPDGYEVDVEALSVLNDLTIYPFQSLSSEEYPETEFNFDEKFYNSEFLYPINYNDPPTRSFELASFHHLKVARIEMYPFVTVPGQRILRVYRHFRVRVDHAGQQPTDLLPRTVTYERMYSGLVANYELITPLLPPTQDGQCGSYLIITHDDFYSNAMPLAFWKRAKGLSVTIRSVPSQIPNVADDIRNTIKTFYQQHVSNDAFVLLVGDVDKLTSPPCQGYEWNEFTETCSSDAQYARAAGNDVLPDLFLGRIPADTPADVDVAVEKILDYEQMSEETDKTWLDNALFVAHKEDYPGGYTACKQSVRLYPYSVATPTFDTLYGGEGARNADIAAALRTGRGIVNYRGHGGADCWWAWGQGGQSWCITPNVVALGNGKKTPIIFSVASLTNRIISNDCLGESLVNLEQGGAVVFYGAAADSGRVANDHLDKNLFKAALDEEIQPLGAIVNWAQVRTMEELDGQGDFSSQYNADIYLLLGDPEISLRTRQPEALGAVEHPQWVDAGAQSLEVTVRNTDSEPVSDALVVLRKYKGTSGSADVMVSSYTKGDGTVHLSISPTSPGGLSVTVLKQNYIPYTSDTSLRIIHMERDSEPGSFSFSWQIEPGRAYAVYASDELWPEPSWSLLGISPTIDGLTMTLTDTTSGFVPQRFYKVQAR